MNRKSLGGVLLVGLAIFTWLFGDNLYQQITGQSVFSRFPGSPTPILVIIATPPPTFAAPTETTQPIETNPPTPENTAIPTNTIVITADEVTPLIVGVDGEMQQVLGWWREDEQGSSDGILDPTATSVDEKCIGMAWNTNEFGYHRLIVFLKPTQITFADGGWYVKMCTPNYISISPAEIGKIQADWLGKRYGVDSQPWEVRIID